ncbi:MAG: TPM domain-containing protein, partial [Pseudomonadota bacterium]
ERYGDEIAVATVSRLDGVSIDQYTLALAQRWRLGDSGRDDGVLILVAPGERKVRIEVGFGLESALTDTDAQTLIATHFVPPFRAGDLDGGVRDGTLAVMAHLANRGSGAAGTRSSGHSMVVPLVFAGLFAATHFLGKRLRKQVIETVIGAGIAAVLVNAISGQWLLALVAGAIAGVVMFKHAQRVPTLHGDPSLNSAPDKSEYPPEPTHTEGNNPEHLGGQGRNPSASESGRGQGEGGGFGGGGASGGW